MLHRAQLLPLLVAALLPATPIQGAENDSPFSFEFSAGAEYDSNVAVLELDTSSGRSDVAALIDFGIGFDKPLTDALKLKLGYDFSQSLHEEFDQFDLRVHRGSGELGYDFGRIDLGMAYHHADASLDDDGFLVLRRTAPYVSRLFGEKLFLRLEYARSDKEFEGAPSRDAVSDAWSVDTFVFLDGVKHYLILGYGDLEEDALDDQFDYSGSKLKAQLARRIGARDRLKLKSGLRYESREYDALLVLAPREDDRFAFEAELEWTLGKKGFLRSRYEYNDNRSNLSSVDFDEHVVSVELGGKF